MSKAASQAVRCGDGETGGSGECDDGFYRSDVGSCSGDCEFQTVRCGGICDVFGSKHAGFRFRDEPDFSSDASLMNGFSVAAAADRFAVGSIVPASLADDSSYGQLYHYVGGADQWLNERLLGVVQASVVRLGCLSTR